METAAMVQIVENHADISGTLIAAAPAADRPGHVTLTVRVDAASDVAPWPNLFGRDVGAEIGVLARAGSQAARAAPGPIRLRVRKAGPALVFADED